MTAFLITLVGTAPAGAQQSGAVPGEVRDDSYQIGPRDLVRIEVYELPELDGDRRVSRQGTVRLPVAGDVAVEGHTEASLARHLEELLEAQFVENASVTVQVQEYRHRSITLMGAVRQPGEYGLPGDWTLLEAITAAGGLADDHGTSIHVQRRADNDLSDQLTIAVADLVVRGEPLANIPLLPDDIVNVEKQEPIRIYLLGEVASPGMLTFDNSEQATLLYAIARAGGLGERAASKIRIQRRLDNGETEQIVAHYKRILTGKDPDLRLQDGDVLVVKESFL